jgi:parallel beta-helix repeat protein
MERCKIEAAEASFGIFVHPGGSANLKRVDIMHSQGAGVSCSSGSITMEHCSVHACAGIGMVMAGHGVASVRRSTISDNGECGVLIQDEAHGIWTGNDIFGNQLAGIAISSSSDQCQLRLNNVYSNKQAGLQVFNGGVPHVSASSFYHNHVAGIVCQSQAMPRLSSCKVYKNLGCGILMDSHSAGEMRQCEVYGNQLAGLATKEGACPTLYECCIRDGEDAGVLVYGSAAPVLHDCQIDRNALAGVAVSTMAAPHLVRCKLTGNTAGISIVDGGQGVYTNCTLSANGMVQVEVIESKAKCPELRGCVIEAGKGCGIVIRGEGTCVLVDCEVRRHALIGLVVAGSGAHLSMQGGVLQANDTGGLYVSELARVSCTRVSVQDNGAVGALVKRGAIPAFVDCSFSNNQGPGVWFSERAAGSMQGCSIVGT